MGARALTRVCLLAAAAGCDAPPHGGAALLQAGEVVIGRAALDGRIVLLTTEPALITADLRTRGLQRTAIADRASGPKFWGLGEADGALYTVAGFTDLTRLEPDGSARHTARFQRPIGNLLDTEAGMAAQLAGDNPGGPLAWAVDPSAGMAALRGRLRSSLAMSRAEEGVLHLLTCSAPPRVLCWLPGTNELLTISNTHVSAVARLDTVASIAPARLLARPDQRAIQDALSTDRGTFLVLYRMPDEGDRVIAAEFGASGEQLRILTPAEPLRLLLGVHEDVVLAITTSGQVTEVRM
ncbi:MAG TPA: hypothetical protein VFZ36_11060 [Vicinamibacterales bacterium]